MRRTPFSKKIPFSLGPTGLPLLCGALLFGACEGSKAVEARSAESSGSAEAPANEVDLEPGNRKLQYVKLGEATVGVLAGLTAATGKVAFDEDRTSRVGSPLSGRVDGINVKPGDVVKKGQALLAIVSPEVEGAISEFRSAEADLNLSKRSLERLRGLYADRAVAQKEVAQSESDVVKARASLSRTESRLELLHISPAADSTRFTLRAPIAGTVVDRAALPGAEVRADSGLPLVTISDLSRLWILADVYERHLSHVKTGLVADISVASYPGEVFKARIDHIGEVVDSMTRTVKVRMSVDNPEHKLKPEMFAKVTLPLNGPASAVTVPSGAVLTDGESNVVMLVTGNNRFSKRKVLVEPSQDGRSVVLEGLRPGERIVTEGALFLKAEIENR